MHVDPNARCSSKMMCPTKCGPDEMHCPGGMDYDGCPMPDTCVPSKTADGCPAKGWCMHNDDTAICKNFCPPQCGPDDMVCPGGEDSMGCKIPDTCMPSKATATECVDKKSAKKCNKAKNKGKCHKSWAQRDWQLTCGVCTSGANNTCPP